MQVTGTQNYFLIDYTVALTKSGHNYHIGDTLYFSYGGNNFSARVASTGDILSGYDYPSSTYAAIKTNTWDSDTVLLKYLVTGTGKIYGNGGPGGLGGNSGASGLPGFPGSHCIGADNSCELVIESGGEVRAGGGGGGGGGGYYFNQNAIIGNYACSSRGGKGGKGTGWDLPNGPQNGSPPSNNCRGSGNNCNPGGGGGAAAGYGGNSGDWGVDGLSGCNATATKAPGETEDLGNGGSAGPAGAAIIRSDSNITVSVTNNGTISGATDKVGSFS